MRHVQAPAVGSKDLRGLSARCLSLRRVGAADRDLSRSTGESYVVAAGCPHSVENAGGTSAVFLILQGIGEHDFVPLT
jgi:hypothetical protein